jgi:hypothetical protein
MQEDRGRTLERKGPGYSRWTDVEKVSVPGLPMFVPDVLSETELEALILRYRIDEIGFKLAQNLLDIDLRARYVMVSGVLSPIESCNRRIKESALPVRLSFSLLTLF